MGTTAPPPEPPDYDTGASDLIIPRHADALNLAAGCTANGMPTSCDLVNSMLENDSAIQVVAASMFATVKNKETGAVLFDGAVTINGGMGIGMIDASSVSGTGVMTGSANFTANEVAQAQARGNWSGLFASFTGGGTYAGSASSQANELRDVSFPIEYGIYEDGSLTTSFHLDGVPSYNTALSDFAGDLGDASRNPCNPLNLNGYARPFLRAFERAIGQDIAPDGVKIEGGFLGYSVGLENTRDGAVILSGSGNIDPKTLFVDIPSAIKTGTRLSGSASFTGQKILQSGNIIDPEVRTGILSGDSVSFGGGYKLYGGLEVANPTQRGGQSSSHILNGGFGGGVNAGGISYGLHLFNGCFRW